MQIPGPIRLRRYKLSPKASLIPGKPVEAAKNFLKQGAPGVPVAFGHKVDHNLVAFGDLWRETYESNPKNRLVCVPHSGKWFGADSLARFHGSAFEYSQIPNIISGGSPEVLFAGRTNAGKSNLVSALTGDKGIVKISRKPGSTKAFNFFRVGSARLPDDQYIVLVDGPGYGGRGTEESGAFFDEYVLNRPNLKHIFLLLNLDDPVNRYDRMMLTHISSLLANHPRGVRFQPVFTKLDKLPGKMAAKKLLEARNALYDLAPDALQPWYLVRAGGKPAERVGIAELQVATALGSGLAFLRDPKQVLDSEARDPDKYVKRAVPGRQPGLKRENPPHVLQSRIKRP